MNVWGEPSMEAVVARLAEEAYLASPSSARLALDKAGQTRFQAVIQDHIRDLMDEMRVNLRLPSKAKMLEHLIASTENRLNAGHEPCRKCVDALMRSRGQRLATVSGPIASLQYDRWNKLRDKYMARNGHGRTKAETLERIIVETWVASWRPPHPPGSRTCLGYDQRS